MSSNKKSTETARVQLLIAGTGKHFPNAASLAFGGATYSSVALTELFTSFLTLFTDTDAARAALKAKLVVERNQAPSLRVIISAYRTFVLATFGNSPQILADFGLSPRKAKAPLTVEAKAQVVALNKATRVARHTTGPKARAKIKGQVPAPANSGTPAEPAISPAAGATPATK